MRPRERLESEGIDNLSELELIMLLLGTGSVGRPLKTVAKEVEGKLKDGKCKRTREEYKIQSKGTELYSLYDAISTIQGIGKAKRAAIIAGIELGRRLFDPKYLDRRKLLSSKDAYELFKELANKEREYLEAAYINARFEVISKELLAVGSLDQVGMNPREVLVTGLRLNAYGIVVAHNHPSGDPKPSRDDNAATLRLKRACDIVGLKLIDHLIVAKNGWSRVEI